jgi:thiol-disulfide isomerase/thioredoxin
MQRNVGDRVGLGLAALVALGVVGYYVARDVQGARLIPVAQRRSVPELQLPTLGGGEWRLSEHRGRVVLVNFWATWCGPCREELPALADLARRYQAQGVAVAGVALDEGGAAVVGPFVARMGLGYPVLVPAEATRAALAGSVESVPTTVLFDRQGRIAQRYTGAFPKVTFARAIEQLLSER